MATDLGSARRAIGSSNEAARQGIDKRMQAERRGSALQDDINSLMRPERQSKTLRTIEPRGALPPQQGRANYKAPVISSGGVAWPLTEKTKVVGADTVPDRDYYAAQTITTSDGIFTFEVLPVHKLKLIDAAAVDGEIILAEPAP